MILYIFSDSIFDLNSQLFKSIYILVSISIGWSFFLYYPFREKHWKSYSNPEIQKTKKNVFRKLFFFLCILFEACFSLKTNPRILSFLFFSTTTTTKPYVNLRKNKATKKKEAKKEEEEQILKILADSKKTTTTKKLP